MAINNIPHGIDMPRIKFSYISSDLLSAGPTVTYSPLDYTSHLDPFSFDIKTE